MQPKRWEALVELRSVNNHKCKSRENENHMGGRGHGGELCVHSQRRGECTCMKATQTW